MKVNVKRRITGPDAPELGSVDVVSSTELDVTLGRAATGPTRIQEYVLERRVYGAASFIEIARGIDIFGAGNAFPDAGLVANTNYEYRCKAVDTTARESDWCSPSFGNTAAAVTILPPISVSATSIAGGIRVAWSAPASGLAPTSYEVQRTYAADGTWGVKTTQSGTSYDDPDVTEGQSKWYRIVSLNGGSRSDYSATVTATGGASGGTARRWTPGHYIKTQGSYSSASQSAYWTQVFSEMDRAAAYAPMKGAYVNVAWGAFNTTGSTYNWDALDSLFAKAVSLGQQLIVAITYKNFEGSVGLIAPADLISTQTYPTSSGYIAAVWRSEVMNRFISAYQAFATRYKDHASLEASSWSESTPSFAGGAAPSDYSRAALSTQLQVLTVSAVPMFPTSWVLCNVNSLSGQLTQMIYSAFNAGGGFSTPDAVDTNGIRIFRGESVAGEQPPTQGDLRGRMMHEEIASQPVLGGKDNNGPPSNVIDWAQTNKVTHLSWVTSISIAPNTWTDIQAAITADPLLHTTYPTG